MYTNCIINLPNISNFLILIREKYTIHEDEESSNKYSSNNLNENVRHLLVNNYP